MIDLLASFVVRVLGLARKDAADRDARARLEREAAEAQRVATEAQAHADRLRARARASRQTTGDSDA